MYFFLLFINVKFRSFLLLKLKGISEIIFDFFTKNVESQKYVLWFVKTLRRYQIFLQETVQTVLSPVLYEFPYKYLRIHRVFELYSKDVFFDSTLLITV